MDIENAAHEAGKLIAQIEKDPSNILCWEDAAPMISALGGSIGVLYGVQHSATICIYIAALMVRRDRSTK